MKILKAQEKEIEILKTNSGSPPNDFWGSNYGNY